MADQAISLPPRFDPRDTRPISRVPICFKLVIEVSKFLVPAMMLVGTHSHIFQVEEHAKQAARNFIEATHLRSRLERCESHYKPLDVPIQGFLACWEIRALSATDSMIITVVPVKMYSADMVTKGCWQNDYGVFGCSIQIESAFTATDYMQNTMILEESETRNSVGNRF